MDDLMNRRREMIAASRSDIAYEAFNLSFDRTNYIDTGVRLFSAENINKDFEFVAEHIYGPQVSNDATIICAKHNGNAYGFLVRVRNSSDSSYKGTIYVMPNYDNSIVVRRVNGVISIEGDKITNKPKFTNTIFNHPLVFGCAIDDNGNPYRYAQGTIAHVRLRWL